MPKVQGAIPKREKKKKEQLGVGESFALLAKNPYIRDLAFLVSLAHSRQQGQAGMGLRCAARHSTQGCRVCACSWPGLPPTTGPCLSTHTNSCSSQPKPPN